MKLLFIGNSHTYYNAMPDMVRRLLEATGVRAHVTMLAEGGKTLSYHATAPSTIFNIRHGGYDIVIAQERGANFDKSAFLSAARHLYDLTEQARCALYFYMPWPSRTGRMTQTDMTEAYADFCHKSNCFFAPVGEVFARVARVLPGQALIGEDGNHATPFGSYVSAVTIFYTITARKRAVRVSDIDDPGVLMGLPVDICQSVHTEACRLMRLFNG